MYAVFRHPRGVQDLFTAHSHPGSCWALDQADTAMLQCHPTSMQRAVAPAQLCRHVVIQLSKVLYKRLNKPNISIYIDSISGTNVLLPYRSIPRPLGKGGGRYKK